jgi:hypothetical protein
MTGKQRTRIYKNRWFAKFASREGISDAALVAAIDQANRGLVDADLGGGLIKQRVAREGGGKSGGYRTLVFFRHEELAIFAFGFAKSTRPTSARLSCGLQAGRQDRARADAGADRYRSARRRDCSR